MAAQKRLVSADSRLRDHGFVIASRPASGPILWRLDRVVMTQAEGLKLISDRIKVIAAKLNADQRQAT